MFDNDPVLAWVATQIHYLELFCHFNLLCFSLESRFKIKKADWGGVNSLVMKSKGLSFMVSRSQYDIGFDSGFTKQVLISLIIWPVAKNVNQFQVHNKC